MPRSRGRGDQRPEVVERAQLGVDGGVAALVAADRPRDAGIVRPRRRWRCCGPLRNWRADGVDGRQVEHVEAQPRHVRQPGDDVAEGAVPAGLGRRRARETARTRRRSARGRDPRRPRTSPTRVAALGLLAGASARPAGPRARRPGPAAVARRASCAAGREQRAPRPGRPRPPRSRVDDRPDLQVDSVTSWPASSRLPEVVLPGPEAIHPGDDAVLVPAHRRRAELGRQRSLPSGSISDSRHSSLPAPSAAGP